jgi:hypothetical protein
VDAAPVCCGGCFALGILAGVDQNLEGGTISGGRIQYASIRNWFDFLSSFSLCSAVSGSTISNKS